MNPRASKVGSGHSGAVPLRRTRPGLRAAGLAVALTALALVGGCEASEGTAGEAEPGVDVSGGSGAVSTDPASPGLQGADTQLDESRRTAIVRAASRVSPAVVSVNVIRTQRVRPRSLFDELFVPPGASRQVPGLGSGFIYDPSGLVVTNEHVVRDADRIMVTLPDGRDFEAELVGTDEQTDIAVLRIEGDDLPVAPVGTSEGLLIGEWTVAIGNPFGFLISSADPTVTAGVVSAVDRHIIQSEADQRGIYVGMIQTDASINPGNSGGPLVNALGEVVGVNSSILSRSGGSVGLGFAIPIDRVMRIASDLVEGGAVRRAWTGIDVEPAEADPWGRTRGVIVSRVAPGSPAEEAGIEEGDRLVSGNGRRLANPFDFEALILDQRAGDLIALGVETRDAPLEIRAETTPTVRAERVTVLRELELITVTPEVQSERGLRSDQGALVVGISDRLSGQLGIQQGDVLLQVNNRRVRSAEEAAQLFQAVAGTGTVRIYLERNQGISVRTFYWR
ncbi:MAG: trypsin-like peptidase domain-containing protein [Longimicrobiales bacterium]|nr:trypsin-like peptidase domain-containing protein [Longimicrobiales bacterium]